MTGKKALCAHPDTREGILSLSFQSLVFDLDGTLSDPFLGIYRCMNFALTSLGYHPRSEADIKAHIGPPLEQTISKFIDSKDETQIREMVEKYRERYGEFGYQENTLYPGITEMLRELKTLDIPMGVCTSKFRRNALKIIEMFELSEYFDFVSGPEFGMSKAQQLDLLIKDGTIPKNSLMIGDRAIDLTSAHENGLSSAGVTWGFGSEKELLAENPRFLFTSPAQLAQTLASKAG